MAFTTVPTSWLDIGDPTKKELFDQIKTNEDDLDSRTTTLEGTLTNETPIQFQVVGSYFLESVTITGASPIIRVPFNITLTAARLQITDDGASGTLECDIKYYRSAAWNTIFSSKPSIAQGSGDYTQTTGTLSVTSINSADLLRLDITQVMIDNNEFNLYLIWETR